MFEENDRSGTPAMFTVWPCRLSAVPGNSDRQRTTFIFSDKVLVGSGVGTIKPVPRLLVTEVHVVGVEVESDHVPLGFQSLPHQVSPVVGVEGLEIL